MTRNGKIARLPKAVRDTLNARLRDGEPGKRLVAWLNTVPEVQAVLAAEFAARPITENNLSEWKTGGFREWELQQAALERVRNLTEHAEELRATAGALADHLAVVLAVRYAAALAEWDGDPEAGSGKKLRVLRALCEDVVELRRGDHSAARLKLEQERRAEERERTEEEIIAHFTAWAKRPGIRDLLIEDQLSPEEMEARFREIFGLPPKAVPPATGEPDEPASQPVAGVRTGGNEGDEESKADVVSGQSVLTQGDPPPAADPVEPTGPVGADVKAGGKPHSATAATKFPASDDRGTPAARGERRVSSRQNEGTVPLIRPNPTESDRPGRPRFRPRPPPRSGRANGTAFL